MMEWEYDNSCTRPPSFSRLSHGDLLPSPLGATQHAACSRLMLFVPQSEKNSSDDILFPNKHAVFPLWANKYSECLSSLTRVFLKNALLLWPSVFFLSSFIAAWQMASWIRVTTVTQEESPTQLKTAYWKCPVESVYMNIINDYWNLPLRNGTTLQNPCASRGSWRVVPFHRGRFQLLKPCNSERGHLKTRGQG